MIAEPGILLDIWIEGQEVLPSWQEVSDSFIDEKALMGNWIETVFRAWSEGSRIDPRGNAWLDSECLFDVIRVSSLVDLTRFSAHGYESTAFEDRRYLRGSKVARVLDSVIAKVDRAHGRDYRRIAINAEIARELYVLVRDSNPATLRRDRVYDKLKKHRAELLRTRNRKYRIVEDELTGESLKRPELAYIRSPVFYREMEEQLENGLIVNPETSQIIRDHRCGDEKDLFRLCDKMKWSKTWYKKYLESFNL